MAKEIRFDVSRPLIRRLLYPLWTLKNRSPRLRYLKKLELSQYWPASQLQDLQLKLLQRLVVHAVDSCPFYRDSFQKSGVRPSEIRALSDVASLPTISKQEIQENRTALVSTLYEPSVLIRDMTGGSTGSPMVFHYDNDRLDSRVAATLRHNAWAGWRIGDRAALLWGAPRDLQSGAGHKDRIRDWVLDRRMILDASALDEEVMGNFATALLRYRPSVLQAYSNTLGLFAKFVEDRGIEGITPRGIVCSAEVLTDENRARIERVFGCRVFNRYGSREFAVIASECDEHSGLHINDENLLVEVLVNGVPKEGEEGEIVITDLRNLAMPMIRYQIGDMGVMTSARCSCGRGLRLMKLAGGRTTDFLTSTAGQKVSGIVVATYAITNLNGIRQIQFVQNEPGRVIARLVKGFDFTAATTPELASRVRHYLGEDMRLDIEYVDSIPLTTSGKYRFSISNL